MYTTRTQAGPAATGLFCLECDDDTHSAKGCPVARRMYPKAVLAQLPQLEAWMAQRLGRVQTLDRARAWLKVGAYFVCVWRTCMQPCGRRDGSLVCNLFWEPFLRKHRCYTDVLRCNAVYWDVMSLTQVYVRVHRCILVNTPRTAKVDSNIVLTHPAPTHTCTNINRTSFHRTTRPTDRPTLSFPPTHTGHRPHARQPSFRRRPQRQPDTTPLPFLLLPQQPQ